MRSSKGLRPGCRGPSSRPKSIDVAFESVAEITGIQTAQARSRPGREMHAVGHVADVQFVLEIARPHVAQNLFGDLAVQPRHAVDLLREVAGKHRHREFFVRILRIHATQVDKLRPVDAQLPRDSATNTGGSSPRERIVSCRHGRMGREGDEERTTSSASENERRRITGCGCAPAEKMPRDPRCNGKRLARYAATGAPGCRRYPAGSPV